MLTKNEKKTRCRLVVTKKCGCQFMLQWNQIGSECQWELEVVCGTHNHWPIFLRSHVCWAFNSCPRCICAKFVNDQQSTAVNFGCIEKKKLNTKATLRHIYNARLKHRVVERKGQSQMQYLMTKLEVEKYSFHHR
ncbi:hypothetical protein ACS0TY_025083 [Phlomoides rotata]